MVIAIFFYIKELLGRTCNSKTGSKWVKNSHLPIRLGKTTTKLSTRNGNPTSTTTATFRLTVV